MCSQGPQVCRDGEPRGRPQRKSRPSQQDRQHLPLPHSLVRSVQEEGSELRGQPAKEPSLHVDIGMKLLEKYGISKAVIDSMKSHHEEYPYETLEARIVQSADAISASRPGARKDTVENYLQRLAELENVASSFNGVEKVYAVQAGREIRVFVTPEAIDAFA